MNNNLFAVTILSLFYCLTSCMPADANNANEEVSKKQKEIDKLTKELNDAKANAKIQADSNTGITKENYDKTLLLVKEKEKALKELQKQINKLPAAAVVVDDAKVIQLQEELKLANNAKNENAIKINELEDKIKQKEKEIEVNAENLNKLNIEKKQFETQNIDLNKKISELQDQIKNQITESQEELEQAKQAMQKTKKELEQTKQAMLPSHASNLNNQERVIELEEENNKLKKEKEALQNIITEKDKQIKEIQKDLDELLSLDKE